MESKSCLVPSHFQSPFYLKGKTSKNNKKSFSLNVYGNWMRKCVKRSLQRGKQPCIKKFENMLLWFQIYDITYFNLNRKKVDINSLGEETNRQALMLKCLMVQWKIKQEPSGLNVPTLLAGKYLTVHNSFPKKNNVTPLF